MRGFLMGAPAPFIDVKLEDEERRRRGRRPIGKEELDAGLRHGGLDQALQDRGDGFGFLGLCLNIDRDDETVVEVLRSETARLHRVALARWCVRSFCQRAAV